MNSGLDFRVSMSSKPRQTKAQRITGRDGAQTEAMRQEREVGWGGLGGSGRGCGVMCDDEVTRCFESYRSAVFLVPCPSPPITSSDCRTSKDISSSALGSSPSSSSSTWQLWRKHRDSEISIASRAAHVSCRVSPLPPRPHLCHNVGISHIEVIRVKFTAVGWRGGRQGERGGGVAYCRLSAICAFHRPTSFLSGPCD